MRQMRRTQARFGKVHVVSLSLARGGAAAAPGTGAAVVVPCAADEGGGGGGRRVPVGRRWSARRSCS